MDRRECRTVQALLALRPADRSPAERRLIEAHLPTCASCAGVGQVYAAQDRLLQSRLQANLSDAQRERFLTRIVPTAASSRTHAWRSWAVPAALALILLAIVLAVALLSGGSLPTGTTAASPSFVPTSSLTLTPGATPGPTAVPASPLGFSCTPLRGVVQ